eukprot:CAMPEP_0170118222 /NCGR_PEP_ID=MMETSP0020_2-20130122/13572_1 /TAXON_ID=98059 /ORGANISM="Dinobryon sp., Strain UTEXLB2267" /LENGTH=73 /DNA_ID=CAMNT_0010347161 /DNA_START=1102 /DNA_END=1320 /DNA_ORIENTATION=+
MVDVVVDALVAVWVYEKVSQKAVEWACKMAASRVETKDLKLDTKLESVTEMRAAEKLDVLRGSRGAEQWVACW